MEHIILSDRKIKNVLISKGPFRFKIKTCYHNNLIDFFKSLEGRYYDSTTTEWSFPNTVLEEVKNFLVENTFTFKEIESNKFVRLFINDNQILMSFDAHQKNFEIFASIEGGQYDREISKYIFPKERMNELEEILLREGFNYLLNEDSKTSFNFNSNSNARQDFRGEIKSDVSKTSSKDVNTPKSTSIVEDFNLNVINKKKDRYLNFQLFTNHFLIKRLFRFSPI
jgi:hypothetical protein